MKLRRLTEEGLAAFESAIDELKAGAETELPGSLLTGTGLTEVLGANFEPERFKSRFEFAGHIDPLVSSSAVRAYQRDAGLWGWLTVLYFDLVSPIVQGRRKIGALPRYLPRFESHQRYYRHLLAGPWFIYAAHREAPERALALLAGPLDAPGDVVEQLASRQEIVTCPGIVEAITALYFNRKTGKLRRGVSSKGAGSARRLPVVLRQLDLTWDFFSMDGAQVLNLLPAEFDRFASTD